MNFPPQRMQTGGSQLSDGSEKKITLPKIKRSVGDLQIVQMNGQLEDNPFYVPEDYEILKMKEQEKLNRQKERNINQNLKIWEKGVKSKGQYTVGLINSQFKVDEEPDDEYAKLNIVEAAKNAIKNRVRQKEPMHQFIDKKREMLLFQMLIDHKKNQINEFEELTRLHKKGLEKSEGMLEEDIEAFNKFLEENKNNSRQAIKAAEDETKKKQEKQFEIKQLNELRSDLQTKISQKAENLDEFWGYKKFLDRITPKEFMEALERRRKNKKDQPKKKPDENQNSYKKLVDTYNITINKDILEILDDSDEEFEPYFKKPQQLEQIFIDLQEKNLSLIQNTQDREQMAEEIKHRFMQKQKTLNEEKANRIKTKNDLLKNLETVNESIKHLKVVKNDNQAPSQLAQVTAEILKIYKNDYLQDKTGEVRKDISGIEILKEMELKLENQLEQLKYERQRNEKKLQEHERLCTQQRREEIKQSKQEQENKNQQLRQKELDQPKKEKRYGRPIMGRSLLQQEEKEQKVVEEEPEEERERRLYFT